MSDFFGELCFVILIGVLMSLGMSESEATSALFGLGFLLILFGGRSALGKGAHLDKDGDGVISDEEWADVDGDGEISDDERDLLPTKNTDAREDDESWWESNDQEE